MQKDLKIGLILGLVIVSIAGLWLATRPSLTPQARLLKAGDLKRNTNDETRGTIDKIPQNNRLSTTVPRKSSGKTEPVHPAVSGGETKSSSSLATPAVYMQPEKIKPQRFHIVQEGETLSEISYDYYGSAAKWRKIFEANHGTLKNANVVKAGTKLIIPD